ncbi:hypothetical protein BJY04DRAFT_126532 [Aspergillus karnatakaensis]|uniref:uncharacterized protein n=1 Tax=Aspergillus karnatakaensis TaxID=1810916 RepID=UPI003CCCDA54
MHIVTTPEVFRIFISTTQSTLGELTMERMCWTSNFCLEKGREKDLGSEAMGVFREVCVVLGGCVGIRYGTLAGWAFQGRAAETQDLSLGLSFADGDVDGLNGVVYNGRDSRVGFAKWVHGIQATAYCQKNACAVLRMRESQGVDGSF